MSHAIARVRVAETPEAKETDALATAFMTWRLALSRLSALEAEGWSNADYAHALLREKKCFTRLEQLQRDARRRCLPG